MRCSSIAPSPSSSRCIPAPCAQSNASAFDFVPNFAQSTPSGEVCDNARRFGLLKRLRGARNIKTVDPVGYWDFLVLMKNSAFILTDSGGIQEEATAPNIHRMCFVLRTTTERQEALALGFAELVGTRSRDVLKAIKGWLDGGAKVPKGKSPFGDGKAAERSVKILKNTGYS